MRTASEILLDLEEKINLLLGYAKNQDNNIKIILQRLNAMPAAKMEKEEKKPKASPTRTTVNQMVLAKDGQPIKMANVEIFNENGFLEKATRTNNNGRWMAALPPGKYALSITKKGDKLPLEITSNIEVEDTGGNVELPSVTAK